VPTGVTANAGDGQSAAVYLRFDQPLQARVVDANGNPVQGVTVTFASVPGVTGAGASFLGQPTATTGSDGVATSPALLANGTPGLFTVTASADGVATSALFTLHNRAAAALVTAGKTSTRATVEGRYRPLSVTVADTTGQPIEGAAVTFAVAQSAAGAGATFVGGSAQATATTDASGVAVSPALVANTKAGAFAASATVSGVTIPYTLTNVAAAPATITPGAASGQSTRAGTRFPVPFAVTVADRDGNPVAGARVVFTAPAHGPGGHFGALTRVRVTTGEHGIAVAPPFKANRKPGGYVVVAAIGSHRTAFALVNLPR
jgi:adhesin/invasin